MDKIDDVFCHCIVSEAKAVYGKVSGGTVAQQAERYRKRKANGQVYGV